MERKRVASPLSKAARDARKLAELIQSEGCLPRLFGFERKASVRAFVITNPALRLGISGKIDNPNIGAFPSSALFALLWDTGFSNKGLLGKRLNADELYDVARSLSALHLPCFSPSLLDPESYITDRTRQLIARAA